MKVVMHRPDGGVYLAEKPTPVCGPRQMLVRGAFGWISSGTEGGFLRDMRKESAKDPKHYHLGYTASGVVDEPGAETPGFVKGQRVGIYGSPHVGHFTEQPVGRNLAVPVPDNVPLWAASSVGLGAIALHGLRQIGVTLGDVVIQFGLGPLGMIAGQLTEAMGADLIAVDLQQSRVDVFNSILPGRAFRADTVDLKDLALKRTRGRGADAAVLAISGTTAVTQNLPELLRDRGRVSLLGGSGKAFPDLKGGDRKEIEVKYVRAGGPGRRDPVYEVDGVDYPVGYVPWTENRNMEAYLQLVSKGRVQLGPLVSHCFPIDDAPKAWDLVVEHPEQTLGVLIDLDPGKHEAPPVRAI